mgnify:FL=1|jgi:UDP-N-acetylglucosamine 2-epimerase
MWVYHWRLNLEKIVLLLGLILMLPAITIRYAHERPEGMDDGILIMSGLKSNEVLEAVDVVCEQHLQNGPMRPVSDYEALDVSRKIVRS